MRSILAEFAGTANVPGLDALSRRRVIECVHPPAFVVAWVPLS
jgi:hypothetical protein